MLMYWFLLFMAGVFESAFAIGLKLCDGFSKPIPSILTAIAIVLSMLMMSMAMRGIPVAIAYAVWVGIGVAGSLALSYLFLEEPISAMQVVSVSLIITGVIGLKITSTG